VEVKILRWNLRSLAQPPPGFSELIGFPVREEQRLIRCRLVKNGRGGGIQGQFERPSLERGRGFRRPIPQPIFAAVDILPARFKNQLLAERQIHGQRDWTEPLG